MPAIVRKISRLRVSDIDPLYTERIGHSEGIPVRSRPRGISPLDIHMGALVYFDHRWLHARTAGLPKVLQWLLAPGYTRATSPEARPRLSLGFPLPLGGCPSRAPKVGRNVRLGTNIRGKRSNVMGDAGPTEARSRPPLVSCRYGPGMDSVITTDGPSFFVRFHRSVISAESVDLA